MALLSKDIADAVARDGLPRQATADDESRHVLFLENGGLRSTLASDWPPPLPSDPTAAQSAAAIAALDAAAAQSKADATLLRTRVLTLAQSAVGVQIDQLTAPQIRALVALLLFKQGAIDKSGAVLPLAGWL